MAWRGHGRIDCPAGTSAGNAPAKAPSSAAPPRPSSNSAGRRPRAVLSVAPPEPPAPQPVASSGRAWPWAVASALLAAPRRPDPCRRRDRASTARPHEPAVPQSMTPRQQPNTGPQRRPPADPTTTPNRPRNQPQPAGRTPRQGQKTPLRMGSGTGTDARDENLTHQQTATRSRRTTSCTRTSRKSTKAWIDQVISRE